MKQERGNWRPLQRDELRPERRHDAYKAKAKLPEQLEVRWEYKTGDAVEGAPAIAGGVVYVASFDKHLHAIDLATGKAKWKVKLGAMKASGIVRSWWAMLSSGMVP